MKKNISVRLPEWVAEKVEKTANRKAIPESTVVRMYLVERLRELSESEEEEMVDEKVTTKKER